MIDHRDEPGTDDVRQLKVTAHLISPIIGDVPHLDSLLENEMAQRLGVAAKFHRGDAIPPPGVIHIPMLRGAFGSEPHIARCSSPIYRTDHEYVERFAKRLATDHSALLADDERRVLPVGNGTYKSYRLPLKVQCVSRVVWFCRGHRRPIKSLLRSVKSLGRKRSIGYGRVAKWDLEMIEGDYSWFAPATNDSESVVLMRPLPWSDQLPANLIGHRRGFGACAPPYWHPSRFAEIVVPC